VLAQESLTRPLAQAAQKGAKGPLEAFFAKGGDVNAVDDSATLLHYALANNQLALVDWLLAKGASLETVAPQGEPVIFLALRMKDIALLNTLLDKGASLESTGSYGATPLLVALSLPWRAGVEVLLSKGARLDVEATIFHYGPLHYAVLGGDIELVEMMLDRGISPATSAGYKGPPLHLAAEEGKLDLVKLLVARGADVNAVDPEYQSTALHRAASGSCAISGQYEPTHPINQDKGCAGKLDVARFLLEKGAKVNGIGKYGWAPLDYCKDPAMEALLKKHGGKRKKSEQK
jgi:ankyrin repeat protein